MLIVKWFSCDAALMVRLDRESTRRSGGGHLVLLVRRTVRDPSDVTVESSDWPRGQM